MALKPNTVKLNRVRLSYCKIFKPDAMNEGATPKYSTAILIDKKNVHMIEDIKKAVEVATKEGIASKWNGKKPGMLKTPLRDGDVERPDDPAYAGHYFFNASNTRKPLVIDLDKNPIIDEMEVYSGCYAKAIITFYPYNASGNRGIAASLDGIQKLEDGEALGGLGATPDDFDDDDSFIG